MPHLKPKNSPKNLELHNATLDAPKPDEVEISLFGPSYGECVVVHAGNGIWFVVDSCKIPDTSDKPQALEYFESIGVNPSTAVKKIIATHWDGDHIGGLSRLVEAAQESEFVVSGAMFCKEFLTLVSLYNKSELETGISVKEYSKVLRILEKRGKKPLLAQQQMTIWNKLVGTEEVASLVSLAPSNEEVINGKLHIAEMLGKKRFTEPKRNHRSIVLWLKVENAIALLGSDLEEVSDNGRGWEAIILSGVRRPKSQIFKVPHHGSKSAHNAKIWSELLESNPPAIVAPWRKGNQVLPTTDDIERLQKTAGGLYVTAIPQNHKKTRQAGVQSIIDLTVKNIRKVDEGFGHVRLRANYKMQNPVWEVALFNGARKIEGRMSKAFQKSKI